MQDSQDQAIKVSQDKANKDDDAVVVDADVVVARTRASHALNNNGCSILTMRPTNCASASNLKLGVGTNVSITRIPKMRLTRIPKILVTRIPNTKLTRNPTYYTCT